jgi:hypothetical protein
MKTRLLLLALLAAGPVLWADAAGPAGINYNSTQPLVVTIEPPASPQQLWSDHVARILADYIEFGFDEAGYRGQLTYLGRSSARPAALPRLDIHLRDWHESVPGTVDCTFTARLITATGIHDLGVVSGTAIDVSAWFDPQTRAEGIQSSAKMAARWLYRTLVTEKLLPTHAA